MKVAIDYNPHFEPFFLNEDRYSVLWGGAGSGKSYSAAQKLILRCLQEPGHRFLVCRKVANTIRESCYKLLDTVVTDFGIRGITTTNKTNMGFEFSNGSSIITAGLDDPEKLKSIHGITGIWIEEATDLELSDISQLDLRLRGETHSYKQIILTFNPIDETHWIKEMFFDKAPESTFTLHSTYLNNPFLDDEYVQMLNENMIGDENQVRIYRQGIWGRVRTGQEFYHNFRYDKHVKSVPFLPDKAVHLSFDFNLVPYCTLVCIQLEQIEQRWKIRVFDEFCLSNPYNDPEWLCKRFLEKYSTHIKGSQVFIYGDATGRTTHTAAGKAGFYKKNNYDLIQDNLRGYVTDKSMRVPYNNPKLSIRRQVINRMLSGEWLFEIEIDKGCKNVITDFENVLDDPDGGKLKKRITDKKTGISYEKYGHTSDCFDYMAVKCFENYIK